LKREELLGFLSGQQNCPTIEAPKSKTGEAQKLGNTQGLKNTSSKVGGKANLKSPE
jgi:hypothetical protein